MLMEGTMDNRFNGWIGKAQSRASGLATVVAVTSGLLAYRELGDMGKGKKGKTRVCMQ